MPRGAGASPYGRRSPSAWEFAAPSELLVLLRVRPPDALPLRLQPPVPLKLQPLVIHHRPLPHPDRHDGSSRLPLQPPPQLQGLGGRRFDCSPAG